MKEYDVHFSLNGFYRKVEANSQEEAMGIAEEWINDIKTEIEMHIRTGISIEIVEAVEPE